MLSLPFASKLTFHAPERLSDPMATASDRRKPTSSILSETSVRPDGYDAPFRMVRTLPSREIVAAATPSSSTSVSITSTSATSPAGPPSVRSPRRRTTAPIW